MRWATIQAGVCVLLALLCLACFSGCKQAASDARDARNRHLRRAIAAKEAQDIDRAIALCEKALARRPGLALAHRELGLMLDNYSQDYVAAIYHYQCYLELRPDSEDQQAVGELIRHCRTSFAAQISESPQELQRGLKDRDERIRKLELEVALLREQAAGLRSAPAAAAAEKARSRQDIPSTPPAPAPEAMPPPVHVVQAGENLATISMRYYGTPSKWKTIFNANREKLSDANNLRVGIQLSIPKE